MNAKILMFKVFVVGLILTAFCQFAFAQNNSLSKAFDYYFSKDYCNALDNFEKAMKAQELANYPMYYAAQSACQCKKPESAFKYFLKSFEKTQDFYNYDFFAKDTLNSCFSDTPEWKKTIGEMKVKYETFLAAKEQYKKSISDQTLRLNHLPDQEKAFVQKLQKLSGKKLVQHLKKFKEYQTPPKTDHWTLYSINSKDNNSIPFLLYIPKDYRPSEAKPLFIYLHGAVSNRKQFSTESMIPLFEKDVLGNLTETNSFIIYPFAKKDFNWLDNEQALEAISREIHLVKKLYNIDDNRVYIGGHSDGARGAFWFALNNRTDFAGFYTFALLPNLSLGQSFYGNLTNEQKLFTLNGTDDELFKFDVVSGIYDKLKTQNPNWIFTPLKGAGHNFMGDYQAEVKNTFTALLKERRNPCPRSIHWQTDDDTKRNFWLSIKRLSIANENQESNSTKEHKQVASVNAGYANNVFELETSASDELQILIPFGMIDYNKPVKISVNKQLKFNEKIKIDKETVINSFLDAWDREFLVTNKISIKTDKH
jgi:predicted esterase